jgi:ssDNA-binding replication factor A large subunit
MNIAELKVKQGGVNLEGVEVIEKSPVREFAKFGRAGKVCNVVIKDGSGTVQLTLWNDDVDKYDVGDKLKIVDCFVGEWQGEKQVTTGRNGTIEKL